MMEQQLKQRVVGAIVLISIAVIFIPMLFEERSELGDLSINETNIPPFPVKQFEEKSLPVPTVEKIEQQFKEQPAKAEVSIRPVVVKKSASKKTKATVKQPLKMAPSFVVQVGSFGKKANAQSFVERLKKAGFPTFLKQSSANKTVMYRVLVGPGLDRERANANKIKLEKMFKLKAIVLEQAKG